MMAGALLSFILFVVLVPFWEGGAFVALMLAVALACASWLRAIDWLIKRR